MIHRVIDIQLRAHHVLLRDERTGEERKDVVVLDKECLRAAALLGMTNEDVLYRMCNRKGYRVEQIIRVEKLTAEVDLHRLYLEQSEQEGGACDAE